MAIRELAIGAGLAAIIGLSVVGVNVLPIALIAGLMIVLWRMPGVKSLFQGQAPTVTRVNPVTFDDIGGQETAKQELREALEFIARREDSTKLGIRPLRGILLTGPPGTGKTLLARAAARYTGAAFLSASGSEFVEMYAGVGAQRIRDLFQRARQAARRVSTASAIIFVDEIEVVAGRRGKHSSHLEYDQTLNQLLVEMDGIGTGTREQVLVVGATNRVDLLDPALLRPGRFDRVVTVGMPDREGRLQILRLHANGKPLADDVDLDRLARETFGFSGAHLESVANEAAILAMRQSASIITLAHFVEAVDKVAMGERLDRRPCRDEIRRIAVHEVGHALVSERLRPGSVSSITVASRGNALGYIRQEQTEERNLQTADDITGDIDMLVAGAAAEVVVFGDQSTGAASDFNRAVGLARRMIGAGLSDLGVVDVDAMPPGVMHRAVKQLVFMRQQQVLRELEESRDLIDLAAGVLCEREKLDGAELRALLGQQQDSSDGAAAD